MCGDWNNLLTACPVAAVVDAYTNHMQASKKGGDHPCCLERESGYEDENYEPPGRLRDFDMIVFDDPN